MIKQNKNSKAIIGSVAASVTKAMCKDASTRLDSKRAVLGRDAQGA